MTTKKKTGKDMLRVVFDAIPLPVFVLDGDTRIQEYNPAAAGLLALKKKTVLGRRCGEAFHCRHATDVPEGCGMAPSCRNCLIRKTVRDAFRGKRFIRRRTKMELARQTRTVEHHVLISASPFSFHGKPLVLLVVEDISQLVELQQIIPICSVCKKIRTDKDYWMQVDSYFNRYWAMDFTHSICPECLKTRVKEKFEKGEPS